MASPTEAEVKTQIQNATRILNELRKYAGVNATNYLGTEDTYIQALETNYPDEATVAVAALRADLANAIGKGSRLMTPHLRDYGKLIAAPETDPVKILDRLYDYYIANTLSVKSRAFTFGSPAAGGGNSGTGVVNRLNTDAEGFPLEAQTPDAKVIKCIQDGVNGGIRHQETFEITSAAPSRDLLLISGSGRVTQARALSAADSEAFIANPSFSQYTGTLTVIDDLTNWTVADLTDLELDDTNYYRGFEGDTTPLALKFLDNELLTQSFDVRRLQADAKVPLYIQIAYNRQVGSGDGTLTLRFGAVSANVVLAAQTGWNILRIAVGANNWFANFNEQNPTIEIELSGRTTGTVLVDDIIVAPYTPHDGSWYAIVGGATPFLKDDVFTFSDSATDSIIQHWLWRAFGKYLPSNNAAGETWTDPA